MPRLSPTQAAAYAPMLRTALQVLDPIDTTLRISAFLAQIAHESGELRYWTEIGNYCVNYEGRTSLGNTQAGDGCRFKGRGPLQLTGRANYDRAGRDLGVDLVADPESVAQPGNGFKTAVWFWSVRKLNAFADVGDFNAITRRVNGGYNGKADREKYYARAKACLGGVTHASVDGRQWRSVERGASGPVVAAIQLLLLEKKYLDSLEADVDADFGPRTERAMLAFQRDSSLAIDGVVGPSTWVSLIISVRRGSTDRFAVRAVQTLLSDKFKYELDVDGAFGPGTAAVVTKFQTSLDLGADGVVGPGTWNALVSATEPSSEAYSLVVSDNGELSTTYETEMASESDILGPEVPARSNAESTSSTTGGDAASGSSNSGSKLALIVGLTVGPACIALGLAGGFLVGKRRAAAAGPAGGRRI
jgi:predicted chitinase/peptidoglycan hydrolase-like protein with peptidoglycan-binding domain